MSDNENEELMKQNLMNIQSTSKQIVNTQLVIKKKEEGKEKEEEKKEEKKDLDKIKNSKCDKNIYKLASIVYSDDEDYDYSNHSNLDYEVDFITQRRVVNNNRVQNLVKWKNYPISESSWVYSEEINAPRLMKAFDEFYEKIEKNPEILKPKSQFFFDDDDA